MRSSLPFRAIFGLLAGFVGASVTIEAIDRFGDEPLQVERLEVVVGQPNFEEYCSRDESGLVVTSARGDPFGWGCSGPISGLFSTIAINIDDVCRTQFEPRTRARLFELGNPNGWRCISDP